MRDAPYLHAKHLDEAVRQQVITSEQREALDALARTMAPDGGPALPELAWFRWMLAAAVAGGGGVPGWSRSAPRAPCRRTSFLRRGSWRWGSPRGSPRYCATVGSTRW